MQEIRVLFDVPEHHVSVSAFVASAQSAERVIAALNEDVFKETFDLHLVVASPESGSLRQVLKVVVKGAKIAGWTGGGAWAIFFSIVQVLETEIAKDVIDELYGETPAEIASRIAGEYQEKRALAKTEEQSQALEKEAVRKLCQEVEKVFSGASSSALAAPREDLESLPLSESARFEITDAQSRLFEKCIEDSSINALNFENTDAPSIPRNEFPARAIRPRKPEKKPNDDIHWDVTVREITVTSPNLDEDDQLTRRWKGKSDLDKSILFVIDDSEFWSKLHRREVKFGENDKILAQLAIRFVNGRAKENRVLRVIKFNHTEIGRELDENALSSILGDLSTSNLTEDGNLSLFEE